VPRRLRSCRCSNADEAGRGAPFRPGYPIFSKADEHYKFLIPEKALVLSHADLKVGSTIVDEAEDQQATVEKNITDPNAKRLNREHLEMEDWRGHMLHLKSIFDMLRSRGVERILKVTVKDNFRRPCRDGIIYECLKDFDVRYLDWQKNDLCIDVVLATAPRVAELTLYSSGIKTVLRGWAARNGLCTLNQVFRASLCCYQAPWRNNDHQN
jgi:hypothetical protein